MNKTTAKILFLCVMFSVFATFENGCANNIAATSGIEACDFNWKFTGAFRPEMFYGRNISLLNNKLENDKTWYMRHTLDLDALLIYGMKTYGQEVARFYGNLRNKAIWGNANIIPTTSTSIKFVDTVFGEHKHQSPRLLMWIRALWLRADVGQILGLDLTNEHTFTIGAFSFELGRGIALGDAYATAPELLGFYTDNNVDQFANGVKLSGGIVEDVLSYDLYAAILQNRSSGLGEVAEKIRGQEYGKLAKPFRGFGIINFLVAGRLNWHAFDTDNFGKLHLEPYAMYNSDPEQRVEVLGDSESKLGTVGFAGEYHGGRFELGFDYAQNFGRQSVKGLDRNKVDAINNNGVLTQINTEVLLNSNTGSKVPFIGDSASQELITKSRDDEILNIDKEAQNGQSIGSVTTGPVIGELFNSNKRFRDAFINKFLGWMFVTDASLWVYKKDLQWAATAGVASGDDNPNEETIDGNYSGFLPVQEAYSGKRVKSAFLMGGAGKAKRPLSSPIDIQSPNRFPSVIDGFTNLIFCGTALNYKPQGVCKAYKIMPNLLAYWQQKPTKKFDIVTGKDTKDDARNFLGIEANIFVDYFILKSLRLYTVNSVFFPGTHYQDIRGKPLNRDQQNALDELDTTGFTKEQVPNIGTDIAYTFNLGMEFKW